jgi:hypothetical protein
MLATNKQEFSDDFYKLLMGQNRKTSTHNEDLAIPASISHVTTRWGQERAYYCVDVLVSTPESFAQSQVAVRQELPRDWSLLVLMHSPSATPDGDRSDQSAIGAAPSAAVSRFKVNARDTAARLAWNSCMSGLKKTLKE